MCASGNKQAFEVCLRKGGDACIPATVDHIANCFLFAAFGATCKWAENLKQIPKKKALQLFLTDTSMFSFPESLAARR